MLVVNISCKHVHVRIYSYPESIIEPQVLYCMAMYNCLRFLALDANDLHFNLLCSGLLQFES